MADAEDDAATAAAAAAAAATAFRLFLLSFFETDFTFGRSLIAVVGDTSDGAIGDDVTVVMLAFGNKFEIFAELVTLTVAGVTTKYYTIFD